jgi:uncharacterized protein DUF2695
VGRATFCSMTNTDDILARIYQAAVEADDPYGDLDARLGDDYGDDYDDDDYDDDDDEVPLAPLPLEPAKRASLIRAIDAGLRERGCDNTVRAAKAWARKEKVPWPWLRTQLEERGGFCDCEVLLNVFRPPDGY